MRFGRSGAVALGAGALLAVGASAASGGDAYRGLLARHVRPGIVDGIRLNLVDYASLARDPSYAVALDDLRRADPDALPSDADRFAFWVNAYNLLAIKVIVDRYPIASIRDAGNLLFPVWKRTAGEVAGRELSLDDVEHGILRKRFDEPRVHFAVVCASLSCPDLRAEPYEGARLEAQLDDQVQRFLADRRRGLRPGADGRSAAISSIFRWFAEDFAARGGVPAFLEANAPAEVRPHIARLDEEHLSYLDYDWSLNDARRALAVAPLTPPPPPR